MFDKLKAMGAIAGLMKNQDKIKESMQRVKEKMAVTRVTGASGGGACRVTVNGQMKVLEVDLAPALVAGMAADNQTRVLAGNLIAEATNEAITLAQRRLKEEVDKEARELGVPELAQGLGDMM
jgi:DNA-binding protein YbaB